MRYQVNVTFEIAASSLDIETMRDLQKLLKERSEGYVEHVVRTFFLDRDIEFEIVRMDHKTEGV